MSDGPAVIAKNLARVPITSVPVVWLDVDDATAKRIMLADNRTADLATYDEQILAEALASLEGLAAYA